MTNPYPDYSAQVKFDSVGERQDSLLAGESKIQDALLSPQIGVIQASSNPATGMDQKDSSDGATTKPLSVVRISRSAIKKTGNPCSSSSAKKNIGFLLADKKKVVEEVFEYPKYPRDDQQHTDEELDEMLTNAMIIAHYYTVKRKDWQNKIKFLLKGCSNRDLKAEPQPLKAADLDFVVDTNARGLELYIHPIFQKNRVKAIRSVVKVQKEYNAQEKKKGANDPELRVKVLRAQSMKYTLPARLLAKTLASGDARAATKKEEDTQVVASKDETERADGTPAAE